MPDVLGFFAGHELLGWLALAAVLLAIELGTGSGWLLWPAGAAALSGLLSQFFPMPLYEQIAVFAVVTIVATFAGRGMVGRARQGGDNPNEAGVRLIGKSGTATGPFEGGLGRVFVDGKEWSAELDGDGPLAEGVRVKVVALQTGARLKVRVA